MSKMEYWCTVGKHWADEIRNYNSSDTACRVCHDAALARGGVCLHIGGFDGHPGAVREVPERCPKRWTEVWDISVGIYKFIPVQAGLPHPFQQCILDEHGEDVKCRLEV